MAKTETQVRETEVQEEKAAEQGAASVPVQGQAEKAAETQPVSIQQIRDMQSLREMEELRAQRAAASAGVPQENQKKVIGIQSIKKKDGSGFAYKLYMSEPYSAYERDHGDCIGVKVSDEYIGDESKLPPDLSIGDIIKITKIQRGQFLSVDEIRILNR